MTRTTITRLRWFANRVNATFVVRKEGKGFLRVPQVRWTRRDSCEG